MNFQFEYEMLPQWPKLAWVAELTRDNRRIKVKCGTRVEQKSDWFCEAVWDEEFAAGNFDQTDIVAGSGCRIRDGSAIFVSSGSILDRLNYIELTDRTLVSNSSCALVAVSGALIDPTYPNYQTDFAKVFYSLKKIDGSLKTSVGDVSFVYFENLAWNGRKIQVIPKPRPDRIFSDFQKYCAFMKTAMQAVIANARDRRRNSSIDPLVALSNGYDSPTVAVLARQAGVEKSFTIGTDRDGMDDSGERIGKKLGFSVDVIERDAWRHVPYAEVDCIAGSGATGEVVFEGMQQRLDGRLLVSGFWGGVIWGQKEKAFDRAFGNHDGSGLSLTEMRLKRGFIHCPAPFWGGLQIADVTRISQSEEMQPWSVGGNYDRPICRRIVEEAGIPRDWFGVHKKGSSDRLLTISNFMTEVSHEDYYTWLRENASAWIRKGRFPPYPILGKCLDQVLIWCVMSPIRRFLIPISRRLYTATQLGFLKSLTITLRKKVRSLDDTRTYHRRYTFPWALDKSIQKYRQ